MPIKIIIYCLYIYRFAAFFLSAFPNTTDYKIPQEYYKVLHAFNANMIASMTV